MGYAQHVDAITAEIARIDAELDRDPLWQEFKTFESVAAIKSAGPRGLALLESLEANPLYTARCKLLEARKILEGAAKGRVSRRRGPSASTASGNDQKQQSSGQRATKKRSRRRASKTASGAKKNSARSKPIPRIDSLKSRLARIGEVPSDLENPNTPPPLPAKADEPVHVAAKPARKVRARESESGSAPLDAPSPVERRSFLSRADVPEADVDIRPSRGSSTQRKDVPKDD